MRPLPILLTIAIAAAALFVVVPLLWDGTNSYVDRNEDLLRSLPVYPGARQIAIESHPYQFRESGPVEGYGTRATFEAPGVPVEALLSFFEANLPEGWTTNRQVVPCISLDGGTCRQMVSLQAVNEAAYAGIDPANLDTPLGSYDVYVDHDSYLAAPPPTPGTMPPAPTPTPTLTPVTR